MVEIITNHERVELKRAVNAWNSHHVQDLLGPLPTKAQVDLRAKKVIERAAFYFGVGLPTIRYWDKHGFVKKDVDNLIDWFRHPSHFYNTHPAATKISKQRIAAERASRYNDGTAWWTNPTGSKIEVASWFIPILQAARNDGVYFIVTDGIRSMAEAWYLWNHRFENDNPVSYPGTSHHCGIWYPDGAIDIGVGASAFAAWLRRNPHKARGLQWAYPDDVVHFSIPGSHHAGETSY